jgi:pre-rRNA-processing protein TSR2
VRRYA